MSRKNRNHNNPPRQSFAQPVSQSDAVRQAQMAAAPDLRQRAIQNAQNEQVAKQKVEALAIQLFIKSQTPLIQSTGTVGDAFDRQSRTNVERSVDSALIFAREVWGVTAQRANNMTNRPAPVTEVTEDDDKPSTLQLPQS